MESHIIFLEPGSVNVRIWATNDEQADKVATRAAEDLGLAWDRRFLVDLLPEVSGRPPTIRYRVLGNHNGRNIENRTRKDL